MKAVRTRKLLRRLPAVFCLAAVRLLLGVPGVCGEEGGPRPAPIDPVKLKAIWEAEAKCLAAAWEITGGDASKLVEAYVSARGNYEALRSTITEKLRSLPQTGESLQQMVEVGEKARLELKEALARDVGVEKTEKIMRILGQSSRSTFELDQMVGDLIVFKLPEDKRQKAILSVLEYNGALHEVMTEAIQAGMRQVPHDESEKAVVRYIEENLRDKATKLTEALSKELAKLLSEEQMAAWKGKYARPFLGGGATPR